MTDEALQTLLGDLESDRVERKSSISDMKKIRQAVCAFANDMPNHRLPGVVFVGVNDDGSCASLDVTDEILRTLSDVRSDGNILPTPDLTVQKREFGGCVVATVVVQPASRPPVRYDGRTWIRVGPRRAIATVQEETRLSEKSLVRSLPFDVQPCHLASLNDIDIRRFLEEYLPAAIALDILEANQRSDKEKLVSLRFCSPGASPQPTNMGVLVMGREPRQFFSADYIQFLRIDGRELTDPILDQKEISGAMPDLLRRLSETLELNIRTATDVTTGVTEIRRPDYPIVSLDQITRNAVLHRTYEASNSPVRVYWFDDRIEVHSPGGPYGQVDRSNFGQPGLADYRNPHLAEALKNLGFVQRFGHGIIRAQDEMKKNGNPPVEFEVEETHIVATLKRAR
jgi:ATP-dependent DNA helicase RecG